MFLDISCCEAKQYYTTIRLIFLLSMLLLRRSIVRCTLLQIVFRDPPTNLVSLMLARLTNLTSTSSRAYLMETMSVFTFLIHFADTDLTHSSKPRLSPSMDSVTLTPVSSLSSRTPQRRPRTLLVGLQPTPTSPSRDSRVLRSESVSRLWE